MREPNNNPNEYGESWDDGTYQTGATPDRKGQSGLITGLLIATIFLGGIASALGVMNVRLLQQLGRQNDPVLPVAVDASGGPADHFLREKPNTVPKLPENRKLQLQVASETAQTIDPAAVTASLTVVDSRNQEKTGPALILSADGFLLTNAHLTDSAISITAQLPDGQSLLATLVACDPYSDLAVVYVEAAGLTAATFAEAATGITGQLPADGFVFEADGRVKGMLCLDLETQQLQLSDSQQLMDIAAQLVETGCVSGRPGLGLQVRAMSNFCREYWDLECGVEITETQVESLLAGDILLCLNGRELTTCHQLHQMLQTMRSGEEVQLKVFRAGQTFTVTLPVTTNP